MKGLVGLIIVLIRSAYFLKKIIQSKIVITLEEITEENSEFRNEMRFDCPLMTDKSTFSLLKRRNS